MSTLTRCDTCGRVDGPDGVTRWRTMGFGRPRQPVRRLWIFLDSEPRHRQADVCSEDCAVKWLKATWKEEDA